MEKKMSSKGTRLPLIGEADYEVALAKASRSGSRLRRVVTWFTHTKKDKIIERDGMIAVHEFHLEKARAEIADLQAQNADLSRENSALEGRNRELGDVIALLEAELSKAQDLSRQAVLIMEEVLVEADQAKRDRDDVLRALPDIEVIQEQSRWLEMQVAELQASETRLREEGQVLVEEFCDLKVKLPEFEHLRLEKSSLEKKMRKLVMERDVLEQYSRCLVKAQARKVLEMCAAGDGLMVHPRLCSVCDQQLGEMSRRPSGRDRELGDLRAAAARRGVEQATNTEVSCLDQVTVVEGLNSCIAKLMDELSRA